MILILQLPQLILLCGKAKTELTLFKLKIPRQNNAVSTNLHCLVNARWFTRRKKKEIKKKQEIKKNMQFINDRFIRYKLCSRNR